MQNGIVPLCRMSQFHSAEYNVAILRSNTSCVAAACRKSARHPASTRCLGQDLRTCAASTISKLSRATCQSIAAGRHLAGTNRSPGLIFCAINSPRCMPSERGRNTTQKTSAGLASSRCLGASLVSRRRTRASLARSRCTRRRGKAALALSLPTTSSTATPRAQEVAKPNVS